MKNKGNWRKYYLKSKVNKQGICIGCGGVTATKRNKRCKTCWGINNRIDPNVDTREYRRNWHIKKKYGITPQDFKNYWEQCKGICIVCNTLLKMPTFTRGQSLDAVAIDHNHITGKVRGILCNACNKALGLFKDDINVLSRAIRYLEKEEKI